MFLYYFTSLTAIIWGFLWTWQDIEHGINLQLCPKDDSDIGDEITGVVKVSIENLNSCTWELIYLLRKKNLKHKMLMHGKGMTKVFFLIYEKSKCIFLPNPLS